MAGRGERTMRRTSPLLALALAVTAGAALAERPLYERLVGNKEPMQETRAPMLPQAVTDGTGRSSASP